MTTLIITRGLPASGKTTRARAWVAEDPVRRARVNRDDLRAMAHDGTFVKGGADSTGTEKGIIAARDALIRSLLKRGVDVVCDDTNLPARTARDLRRLAVLTGADFDVWDLTDVPVEVCVSRDLARAWPVGEGVIRDLHTRYLRGKPHPLPLPDEPAATESEPGVPYVPPRGAPTAVMVDIDGTVALMCARSPYDETRVHEDQPNFPVIEVVCAMREAGHRLVFVSARTEGCRDATEEWLNRHIGFDLAALFMRKAGDMRKDSIVKTEIFNEHIREKYNVVCVLDDRNQVVKMWRELDLTVLQVADGAF